MTRSLIAEPPDFAAVLRELNETEARVLSDAEEIRYATAVAAQRIANRPTPNLDANDREFTPGVTVEVTERLFVARDKAMSWIVVGTRGLLVALDRRIARIQFEGETAPYLLNEKYLRERTRVVDLGGSAA